ncbi:flavodoxin [Salmonella enterica]|nr:flavodoxin [Salmonella enterica]
MKTAVIYGSTTRYTERVAVKIVEQLGFENAELLDIEDAALPKILEYDFLIFGLPTWDYGEIQSSWQNVWDKMDELDFTNKIVAFFGLGDQLGYSEWFVDAMGLLHDKVVVRGAVAIGEWPTEGYTFNTKKSLTADRQAFVGLAIDEVNQEDLTDGRICVWCKQLREIIGH